MSGNAELALEIWSVFKDYVVQKNRSEVAELYVKILEEYGFDLDNLKAEIAGDDPYLDQAISLLCDSEDDDDTIDEDYEI